jgi:hypothetical protein
MRVSGQSAGDARFSSLFPARAMQSDPQTKKARRFHRAFPKFRAERFA